MKPWQLSLLLACAILVLFFISLAIGPSAIGAGEGFRALLAGDDNPLAVVMREIRLPRTILAIMIGGSLGLAGAAMQGYLRNPLAEPGLIGVSGASSLGAVLALQLGFATSTGLALPFAALLGALIAVILLFALAGARGGSLTLILAGIAISALTGALTSLVLNLSANPYAVYETLFWMMGSVADRSFAHIQIALPFMLVGAAMIFTTGRGLDALTLGEDTAETLGISLSRLRLMVVLGVAMLVGAGVAVAGAIGFVGLVVPHILRPLIGAKPSQLLLPSLLGGAAMVLLADIALRVIAPERDLKLGVLTALVGAPFFLHLVLKTRRQML